MPRRRMRRSVMSASVAAMVVLAGTAAGGAYVANRSADGAASPVASVASASSQAAVAGDGRASAATDEEREVEYDALVAAAVRPVAGRARLSVAVLDQESGAGGAYESAAGQTFDTASVVKVDILAALLLTAQDEGRELTAAERASAAAMIENSDNASATRLLQVVGGAGALDAANERLGLTGTTASHAWGLTQTTAADRLRLLEAVFAEGGGRGAALSADSRSYVQELMGQVEADQRWGVSAAGDGDGTLLKNGWMPRTTTGLWDINSVGRVVSGGRTYLVAVLSDGHATQQEGVALVEAAVDAVAAA
ncbi:class A beta-lactamase-related serine hydrolase [Streptomyces sp. NBC_00101]|uniref:serine hydrolase n=1 Tax=Streptomyces sp. NBC_00101 TaxID=2975651 RepID=UPI00324EC99F